MVKLDDSKLAITSLGALLVIIGVILKNTFEQLGQPEHPAGQYLGMIAFVVGWMIVAYAIGTTESGKIVFDQKYILTVLSALIIVGSVIMLKQKAQPMWVYGLGFAMGWLLLGWLVGWAKPPVSTYLGLAGAISVLISMMIVLPWQRKVKVIDGAGLPLFVLGWILVIAGNSLSL